MAPGAYMGASQVQALIGAWQQIVGAEVDTRGRYNVGADVHVGPRPAYQPQPYHHHHHRHHRHHHHHPRGYGYGNYGGGYNQNPYVGNWQDIVGAELFDQVRASAGPSPRNWLEDAPGPQRAGREVLPMSVDGPILPSQSAQITARPQRVAFRPERVFISAASDSSLGAAAWLVNDIKIGNRSQFSQSGSIPGDMFATTAIDSFVSFETAQTAMDVVMVVTYIGSNSDGVSFYGAIIGTAAI